MSSRIASILVSLSSIILVSTNIYVAAQETTSTDALINQAENAANRASQRADEAIDNAQATSEAVSNNSALPDRNCVQYTTNRDISDQYNLSRSLFSNKLNQFEAVASDAAQNSEELQTEFEKYLTSRSDYYRAELKTNSLMRTALSVSCQSEVYDELVPTLRDSLANQQQLARVLFEQVQTVVPLLP